MPLYSEDGQWWWDGARWRPLHQPGRQPDLFWWTQTPDWFSRVLVMGLIGLIPFAGAMALFGWLMEVRDNLLRSRWELPPASFSYLERGLRVFAVRFVYGQMIFLAAVVAAAVVVIFFVALNLPVVGIVGGIAALYLVVLALEVPFLYCYLAIYDLTDRAGVAAALHPVRLFQHAYANNRESLIGAAIFVGGVLLIVAVGSVLPFGSILGQVALPAVLASLAPRLARFQPEAARPAVPEDLARTLVLPPPSP